MACCAGQTRPPTPAEDWRQATVDVVIPALNEADNIVLCLASVLRQTVRPRRIILVDDGSPDGTIERAKRSARITAIELIAIRRRKPIGKTPTIKRQAREFDSDVEFILDADTVLESRQLHRAHRAGAVPGRRHRQRLRDDSSRSGRSDRRDARRTSPRFGRSLARHPGAAPAATDWCCRLLRRGITNMYREVLYLFLQRFVYRGQMVFFGTTTQSGRMRGRVPAQVCSRRCSITSSPILGDDLTNSEDIFIGFAMLNEGYRNIQLTRRLRAHRRARSAAAAAAGLPLVVVVPAVVLLLRPARAESVQGLQAMAEPSRRARWTARAS